MAEYNIEPLKKSPSHVVKANASLKDAILYTDWFVRAGDSQQHYRYSERYLGALSQLSASGRRATHIDIGCGAGVFSWAFFDWATIFGRIEHNRIDLYGFDHCSAMIKLARMISDRLSHKIASYPDVHYYDDVDPLLDKLKENRQENTSYTITFGHVLAQAQTRRDIRNFTRIIVNILMDARSDSVLVAVDAERGDVEFGKGWDALLKSLKGAGVRYSPHDASRALANRRNLARFATLYPV